MTRLLIADSAPPVRTADHHFGGYSVLPIGTEFNWPLCKTCGGAMQYLGRLRIPDKPKVVLLFMCQNDPGMCDDYEADAGGNCAIVVGTNNLVEVRAPSEGVTVRDTEYGAREVESEIENYDSARKAWGEKGGRQRDVLGQIFGKPSWIQGDETPSCKTCQKPMRFLAQLETGPEFNTEMNFGGAGCAYVFDCACAQHSAKFLWQC
jgi:hypothetical protein